MRGAHKHLHGEDFHHPLVLVVYTQCHKRVQFRQVASVLLLVQGQVRVHCQAFAQDRLRGRAEQQSRKRQHERQCAQLPEAESRGRTQRAQVRQPELEEEQARSGA